MKPRPNHDPEYSQMVSLLRAMRLEANVTQAELGARLGVPQSIISKIERQERRLDVAELRRVCVALGVSLLEFVARFEHTLALRESSRADAHSGAQAPTRLLNGRDGPNGSM